MPNPEISVLMGIYNEKDRSRVMEAIDSILEQTFSDFEFVICDDGSDKDFFFWLRKYCRKDPRIVLLRNRKNKGLAVALNRCVRHSVGRFLARMDADDISEKDRLKKQVDFLKAHRQISFVGCSSWMCDSKGIWGKRIVEELPDKNSFLYTSPFIHPTIMIRRQVMLASGGYSERFIVRRTEDYELFMRLFSMGYKGYNIQECLYRYYEDLASYHKRKFRYRINESYIRYEGFKRLGLLRGNIIYVIKPIVIGMIPSFIMRQIRMARFKSLD